VETLPAMSETEKATWSVAAPGPVEVTTGMPLAKIVRGAVSPLDAPLMVTLEVGTKFHVMPASLE